MAGWADLEERVQHLSELIHGGASGRLVEEAALGPQGRAWDALAIG